MENNGISNLLSEINAYNPSLIAGYEAKNLGGKTLRSIYDEYELVCAKRKKMRMARPFFGVLLPLMLMGSLAIFFGVFMLKNNVSPVLAFAPLPVVFVAWAFFFNRILDKAWGYNETIAECEEVLDGFVHSAEALNPDGNILGYQEHYIRENLVVIAGSLLNAEGAFKEVRMCENSSVNFILYLGKQEVEWRKCFEKALSVTSKFNLEFSKPELFFDAKRRLDQTK